MESAELVGQVVASQFRLEKELGRGAMGRVYLAEQVDIARKVVVKLMHAELTLRVPGALERFRLEAKAAAQLNHPNVVQIHVFGQLPDERLYLAMEYIEGQTLAELIQRGPLPEARALRIVDQVCGALSEAHHAGLVHRDLKPENIMICDRQGNRDHVKVLDFGVAKFADVGGAKLTSTGIVVGTPAYMAPEQALGGVVDARTDLYAIGCVLYELLSGAMPFEDENITAVLLRHVTETPLPLSQRFPELVVQPRTVSAVQKCLQKQPSDRFQSAYELQQELRLALSARPSHAQPHLMPRVGTTLELPTTTVPAQAPRSRSAAWLLGVTLAGLLASTAWFDRDSGPVTATKRAAVAESASTRRLMPADTTSTVPTLPSATTKSEPPDREKAEVTALPAEPPALPTPTDASPSEQSARSMTPADASDAGHVRTPEVTAKPVAVERGYKLLSCSTPSSSSRNADVATKLSFFNTTATPTSVYWIDYTGKPVFYKALGPRESYVQETYVSHPWLVSDADGNCIQLLVPTRSGQQSVLIRRPRTPRL